jgi:hypothetical protein
MNKNRYAPLIAIYVILAGVAVATIDPPPIPVCTFYPKCVPDRGPRCIVIEGCQPSAFQGLRVYYKCEEVMLPGCRTTSLDPNSTCAPAPRDPNATCQTLANYFWDENCTEPVEGLTGTCPGEMPNGYCIPGGA